MTEPSLPGRERFAGPVEADEVRETMRVLPGVLAVPLTLLTGKPHAGQRPLRFTPTSHLVNAVCSLIGGLAVGAVGWRSGGWMLVLLVLGWAMTLHGARNLRMMVYHQCAHRNMWGRRRPDALLGNVIAGLLMVQDFERYSAEHVTDHHAVHHMTLRDPTVQAFLVSLELRPGMSREAMWRRLLSTLVSPRFHVSFLAARVRSHLYFASAAQRVCTLGAWALVAGWGVWSGWWPYLLIGWVLPMTLFYQISNTLRLCVKHTFPPAGCETRRGREYFAGLTNAIFLGEAAPSGALPLPARTLCWARWWLRMVTVHFPARYLVLTGDTVCHDFHHRYPMSRNWANYIFAREQDSVAGSSLWPAYRHVWGLVPAIDAVFDSLRVADPLEYDRARLAEVNHRELFTAFDD